MLRIEPRSLFSETYGILEGRKERTAVDIRWFKEAGTFDLDRRSYRIGRDGWMSGLFRLEQGRETLATAEKPSAMRRRFVVDVMGHELELMAASPFSRRFELYDDGRLVGFIAPNSWFTRRGAADLPEELPIEVRVFLIWLVLVMWKRARSSNSS